MLTTSPRQLNSYRNSRACPWVAIEGIAGEGGDCQRARKIFKGDGCGMWAVPFFSGVDNCYKDVIVIVMKLLKFYLQKLRGGCG